MKKLSVLVSCIAVILVVSNVSIAQEGLVEPADAVPTPCSCAAVPVPVAVPEPVPFAYPPYPAAPVGLFAARRAARALPVVAPPAVAPVAAPALPYPYPVNPRVARRAARVAARTAPFAQPAMPMPPIAGPVPMMAGAPPMIAPPDGASTIGHLGQTGKRNISFQRAGNTGPVINFLSLVRTAPAPYAGYPVPMPVQ